MTATVEVVTLTAPQLQELVQTAVCTALNRFTDEQRDRNRPLSAAQAARLARKSPAAVLHALASGSLRGQRNGKSWRVTKGDLDAWMAGGCPP